jgi:hypothetical protein
MSQPRLLIPVTMQFSVRYLLRTGLLARLTEFTQPVIALGWDDAALTREFELAGAEVYRLPEAQRGPAYARVREQLNVWHQQRLASPSTAIDERRTLAQMPAGPRWRRRVRRTLDEWQLQRPGVAETWLAREVQLLHADTNLQSFVEFCARLRVDAAFSLTPYLFDEELLLRACAARQLPLCTAILSFDNLTTRGWIPLNFERYLLWNRYNQNELLRGYPAAAAARVTQVGPAQFDFYWDANYLWPEAEWRQRLSLPAERPVILYGAGHHSIVPHEPHFVAQLDQAIEIGEIPGRPAILFRRHPNDPLERWQALLNQARHVIYEDPWLSTGPVLGRTNVKDEDITRLVSSLCHSAVHVSVSSTMTIDGSIFNRPQIGPAYDDRPGGKFDRIAHELYLREHYLPITDSGGLALARSRAAMIEAVRDAMREPALLAGGRQQLVREICTYTDGQCTKRVAQGVREFLGLADVPSAPQLAAALTV